MTGTSYPNASSQRTVEGLVNMQVCYLLFSYLVNHEKIYHYCKEYKASFDLAPWKKHVMFSVTNNHTGAYLLRIILQDVV